MTKAFLVDGVKECILAFREGFVEFADIQHLGLFTGLELTQIFGQGDAGGLSDAYWSAPVILSAIHADHGFTSESTAVLHLVRFMSDLTHRQRRAFLLFITGSKRLPLGGFKAMHPPLTVVRKHPDPPLQPDDYLPSVMTCANYVKLPDYSSYKVAKARLTQAITEGQGSFDLS